MEIIERVVEEINNDVITQIKIKNESGLEVRLLTLGATWQAFLVPSAGELKNLILGHKQPSDYLSDPLRTGQSIGRVAGRIGGARFDLEGQDILLEANEKGNSLHGGLVGFHRRNWNYQTKQTKEYVEVEFSIPIREEEDHFPGDFVAKICYQLDNKDNLTITFKSEGLTKTSLFNPTNHVYFNLSNKHDLSTHKLQIESEYYLETRKDLIPTGHFLPVLGTPNDFLRPKALWPAIVENDGFDTAFLIKDTVVGSGDPIAVISDSVSKDQISIYSDRNALVIYTMDSIPSNLFFERDKGQEALPTEAIAMEAQTLPDAINHSHFGNIINQVREEQSYKIRFEYKRGD